MRLGRGGTAKEVINCGKRVGRKAKTQVPCSSESKPKQFGLFQDKYLREKSPKRWW